MQSTTIIKINRTGFSIFLSSLWLLILTIAYIQFKSLTNQIEALHPIYQCSFHFDGVFCKTPNSTEKPDFYSTIGTSGIVGKVIQDDDVSFKTTESSITYSCNKLSLLACYNRILKL